VLLFVCPSPAERTRLPEVRIALCTWTTSSAHHRPDTKQLDSSTGTRSGNYVDPIDVEAALASKVSCQIRPPLPDVQDTDCWGSSSIVNGSSWLGVGLPRTHWREQNSTLLRLHNKAGDLSPPSSNATVMAPIDSPCKPRAGFGIACSEKTRLESALLLVLHVPNHSHEADAEFVLANRAGTL
jgi:hypothetical protein